MPTTPRTPNSVGDSYDQFEAAFKAARIPAQLYDALGDVWIDNPARAHHLIARFKDSGATPAVRFKAADALDAAYQQLRAAQADLFGDGPLHTSEGWALVEKLRAMQQGRAYVN